MPKWLGVGLLGVVLLTPPAIYWAWIWISDPVRPSDVSAAFNRLAAVPLAQGSRGRPIEVTVTIPSDASWRRIVRNWGDPGYIIAAISTTSEQRMYCLKDLGIYVHANIDDKPLDLEAAKYAPYGYSLDCTQAGLQFRAPQGAVVKIQFEISNPSPRAASLIVEPYWTVGTKDRLVGISIQQDLHVQSVTTALGIAGIVAILSAFLFWRSDS